MTPEEKKIMKLNMVIGDLVWALDMVILTCENVHHAKRDRHKIGEPCPAVLRIQKLRDKVFEGEP